MDISTPAVYRSLGRDEINAIPLAELDVSSGYIFEDDTVARSRFGPFWSVTTYRHIMEVEVNHQAFSSDSALGGITLAEPLPDERLPSFIAMDPPQHDEQRRTVSPIVAPGNLALLEGTIRSRIKRLQAERLNATIVIFSR